MLAKILNEEQKDVIMLGKLRSLSGATRISESAAEVKNGYSTGSHCR